MEDNSQSDWRETFPDELKLHPSILKFKDPISLGKSYIELEKRMGSRVEMPDFEKAKPEELETFYTKWGRPEKPDAYEYPKLPEGMNIDDGFGNSVKSLAHKLGLNKNQFNQLTQWGIEQSQGMYIEQQKENEKSQSALKAEWGFRYNDNLEKSHKALAMMTGYNDKHPFLKYLETSGMGNNPEFLKFLHEFGEKFSEDKFIDPSIQKTEMNKENAKKRINEIKADTKHPYWNEQDARHTDAVKEMNKLYEEINAE